MCVCVGVWKIVSNLKNGKRTESVMDIRADLPKRVRFHEQCVSEATFERLLPFMEHFYRSQFVSISRWRRRQPAVAPIGAREG